jgi:hypothetical protein
LSLPGEIRNEIYAYALTESPATYNVNYIPVPGEYLERTGSRSEMQVTALIV